MPNISLIQVCQLSIAGSVPAGTKNSTFSVDSEGSVVILYGGAVDAKGYMRYSDLTTTNTSLFSERNIFGPFWGLFRLF